MLTLEKELKRLRRTWSLWGFPSSASSMTQSPFGDWQMSKQAILVSHLTGNINSVAAATAYAKAGLLAEFHVSLVLPALIRGFMAVVWRGSTVLKKRSFPEPLHPVLKSHPLPELLRLACRSFVWLGGSWAGKKYGSLEAAVLRFDAAVAKSVRGLPNLRVVHAYMDTAEQTFLAARKRGIKTVYELPTPYWRFTRDVVLEESGLEPGWAPTLPVMAANSELMRRRDRELQLADLVLVPSKLVKKSLELAPSFGAKVHVIPYGCPESSSCPLENGTMHSGMFHKKLKALYVGSLNQGKGLSYLAGAMEGLENHVDLTIIGSRTSTEPCAALDGFLSGHRHLAGLSHDCLLAEMRSHDVLVLPTLYEGLALVLLEALACGIPVITTVNSGIDGLIQNGNEGFVLPIRDSVSLHDRLQELSKNQAGLQKMKSAALLWSQTNLWSEYQKKLVFLIDALV